jgi:hypothetical protein
VNPGDADPVTRVEVGRFGTQGLDPADRLMPQYDGQRRRRRTALDFVQFSVADRAGRYADEEFVGRRLGNRQFGKFQRGTVLLNPAEPLKEHGLHGAFPHPVFGGGGEVGGGEFCDNTFRGGFELGRDEILQVVGES